MAYSTPIKIVIFVIRAGIAVVVLILQLLRLIKGAKKCPPLDNKILQISARDLAEQIRKQNITSENAVQAYVARIKEVNPIINAVIFDRFEDALLEAKKADQLVRNWSETNDRIEEKYPLLGVPVTIKGSIDVAGLVNTSGTVYRVEKAETDATVVKHLKDAGAIVLLTSNVPELCMNWETVNNLAGRTCNPYNTTRTSGGSSGGEASLVGCGASLIGIGSDLAGSIRLPAHYCGIWGHKPSCFIVSHAGHFPDCENNLEWDTTIGLGPLARYASDLRLLMNIIVEPQYKNTLKLNETVDVKKLKVYYIEDTYSVLADRVSDDILDALRKVTHHFEIMGVKCKKIDMPLMEHCAELSYLKVFLMDMTLGDFLEGKDPTVYWETLKLLVGQASQPYTSVGCALIKRHIHSLPKKVIQNVYKTLDKLKKDLVQLLGDDGILITPISANEAPYHGEAYFKAMNYGFSAVFNALGLPATSCPVSTSKSGMPIGIQVVSGPNMDRLNLSVAEELEKAFGGWKFN